MLGAKRSHRLVARILSAGQRAEESASAGRRRHLLEVVEHEEGGRGAEAVDERVRADRVPADAPPTAAATGG